MAVLVGVNHGRSTSKTRPPAGPTVLLRTTLQLLFVGTSGAEVLGRRAVRAWSRSFRSRSPGGTRAPEDLVGRLHSHRPGGDRPGHCLAGSPPQPATGKGPAAEPVTGRRQMGTS